MAVTRFPALRSRMVVSEGNPGQGLGGTHGQVSPYAAATRCPVLVKRMVLVHGSTSLCRCYAMPGTDITYGGVCLCWCYAMSGTEIAYGGRGGGAWRAQVAAICLRECYAMSGTDLAYGATASSALLRSRGGGVPDGGAGGRDEYRGTGYAPTPSLGNVQYECGVCSNTFAMRCPCMLPPGQSKGCQRRGCTGQTLTCIFIRAPVLKRPYTFVPGSGRYEPPPARLTQKDFTKYGDLNLVFKAAEWLAVSVSLGTSLRSRVQYEHMSTLVSGSMQLHIALPTYLPTCHPYAQTDSATSCPA
eukprot:1985595-Rhodomonas_salina.2